VAASGAPHRTLRIILYAISALEALAGVALLFASPWLLSFARSMPALGASDLLLFLLKGIGIVALVLAYLFCVAARDPVRYVAIVDALIFLCIGAAVLEVYGVAAMHIDRYYPNVYVLSRAALQLILAVVLYVLRPKAPRASD